MENNNLTFDQGELGLLIEAVNEQIFKLRGETYAMAKPDPDQEDEMEEEIEMWSDLQDKLWCEKVSREEKRSCHRRR